MTHTQQNPSRDRLDLIDDLNRYICQTRALVVVLDVASEELVTRKYLAGALWLAGDMIDRIDSCVRKLEKSA